MRSTTLIAQLNSYYASDSGCQALAQETRQILVEGNMTRIFQSGLHEFLADFISRNNRLGNEISGAYHFAD